MKKASTADKQTVVDILARSFDANQSVNYIVKHDAKREQRIKALMAYAFELGMSFGEVLLSDEKRACAIIIYPDKKKVTVKSVWLDVKLIIKVVGIRNVGKVLKREKLINRLRPAIPMTCLWFIGVDPAAQGRGVGFTLLTEIVDYSERQNRPVYLETSTAKNLPWYARCGFELYAELELGYRLYFLRRGVRLTAAKTLTRRLGLSE